MNHLPVRDVAEVALRVRVGHASVSHPGDGQLVRGPRQAAVAAPSPGEGATAARPRLRGLLLQIEGVGRGGRRGLFLERQVPAFPDLGLARSVGRRRVLAVEFYTD